MTPRSAPVGMVRADAPRTKATPSHAPIALAGISRLSGQASPSANQAAPPRAAPPRIDAPNPPIARLASDGVAMARSGAGDGLDDIGRAGGRRRGLAGVRVRPCGEDRLTPVADGQRRLDEPIEQRMRPLRTRLELRVELAGHEPRVVAEL